MKYLIAIAVFCLTLVCAASQQYFGSQFPFRGQRQFRLELAQPSSSAAAPIRDARQDRGPVLFPPPPADAIEESSGVVVGASGFGFVPPQQSTIFG